MSWGCSVTVSLRAMSAGDGYRYLLDSVAVADGPRNRSQPLAAYYAQTGTPPGRWLGSGLAGVGLDAGEVVSEEQIARLLGAGRHPLTGEPLGAAFPTFKTRAERVAARIAGLDTGIDEEQWAAAVARIETEEGARPTRRAVAGYDLTFSVPKSVSSWWAIAAPEVRQRIVAAHHLAIGDVISLMEREVAATRAGARGVVQLDVDGLIATAFDHYDSRTGDPQLHTHVVIANKVRTSSDGKWRSLDGRPVHQALVALSEHYNAILADRLTTELGVQWEHRTRGADRNPAWEITGIPAALVETFSSRSHAINLETDRLISDYRDRHGVGPTAETVIKLRQQATLSTRPDKTLHSLGDLTARWTAQARTVLGVAPSGLTPQTNSAAVVDQLPGNAVDGYALVVVDQVSEKRSTWTRWNLHAEATRQTMHLRFATPHAREHAVAAIVSAAQQASLQITPPEPTPAPPELQRPDGTSRLRPKHATRYTSHALLAAEDRLLQRSRTATRRLTVPADRTDRIAAILAAKDRPLSNDQQAAIAAVVASGRQLDVLIGPAGAGKTTTLTALRHTWQAVHGRGSVVGLAPSAAAAQVLADELGISTENTAKWLHDHLYRRATFRAGQLVIIDEASLASTRTLDLITGHAQMVGAKVLLVGDPNQLGPVGAGGALGLLATDRPDHPRLTQIHRFHHTWEATASLQLRNGNASAIDAYSQRGRVHEGDTDQMLEQAYRAWRHDINTGRTSLLIAATAEQVTALNQRARIDRQAAGHVATRQQVLLGGGTAVSVGDWIITRRNHRNLQTTDGHWVRNGDRFTVTVTHPDGSLTAHRADHPDATVRLPADYVARHVDLGYAITAHRAQGATGDTAHTIATPQMTRETLYVALTRGRHANHAWTINDHPSNEPHHDFLAATGTDVLTQILNNRNADRSAHQTITEEPDRWNSTAQLAAELDTIAAATTQDEPSEAAATAMFERRQLIAERADHRLRTAIGERQPWVTRLGPPPTDFVQRKTWLGHARTIAAYRDRLNITDDDPVGRTHTQHPGRGQAHAALLALHRLSFESSAFASTRLRTSRQQSGPSLLESGMPQVALDQAGLQRIRRHFDHVVRLALDRTRCGSWPLPGHKLGSAACHTLRIECPKTADGGGRTGDG